MKKTILLLALVATCFSAQVAQAASPLLAPESACPASAQFRVQILCYTNYARARSGVAVLRQEPSLDFTAQWKASDIMSCQDFSHTACGRPWDYSIKFAQGPLTTYGENLYMGSGSYAPARSAMDGWLNSPGHLANIKNGAYHRLGVGISTAPFNGRVSAIWVQHFAS